MATKTQQKAAKAAVGDAVSLRRRILDLRLPHEKESTLLKTATDLLGDPCPLWDTHCRTCSTR